MQRVVASLVHDNYVRLPRPLAAAARAVLEAACRDMLGDAGLAFSSLTLLSDKAARDVIGEMQRSVVVPLDNPHTSIPARLQRAHAAYALKSSSELDLRKFRENSASPMRVVRHTSNTVYLNARAMRYLGALDAGIRAARRAAATGVGEPPRKKPRKL